MKKILNSDVIWIVTLIIIDSFIFYFFIHTKKSLAFVFLGALILNVLITAVMCKLLKWDVYYKGGASLPSSYLALLYPAYRVGNLGNVLLLGVVVLVIILFMARVADAD